ncbi:MAG: histidine kinase [Actinomycetota bacterium]|nr:histidine kinase [Actinomycetota bacterium]
MPGGRHTTSVKASVAQFAISGVAALVLVGVIGAIVLDRIGTSEAIREARQITRILGRGVIEPHLSEGLVRGDDQALAALDRIVRRRVLNDPVVRVKLWTRDGRVVYSDEPRQIGSTYPLDQEQHERLTSKGVFAEVADLGGAENRYERPFGKLLEVYLPVRTRGGEPLMFEAYLRFSSIAATGRRIWTRFAPAILAALLLLELIQVPLAWSMAARLRQRQQEREALLQRAIEASDSERRRIARDLHDGVVQNLVGISYALNAASDRIRKAGSDEEATGLKSTAAATRQSIRELRTLLVEIHPPNLHSTGLEAALSDLVTRLNPQGIEARLDVPSGLTLPQDVEALVFRAAQEGVRNALAHARAKKVDVRIERANHSVSLVVEDDGIGFSGHDRQSRVAEGHVGLRLLDELAYESGGTLDVDSEPGRGTRIRLEVPLP